ncbi:MAG: hypothetical protein WC152_07060 [Candidatus Izemoplasmatales bacterium]
MTDKIKNTIDNNAELKDYISSLEIDIKNLEIDNDNLKTVIAEREAEINLLKEAMKLSGAKMLESSSEKTSEGQLSLEFFDGTEKEANLKAEDPTKKELMKRKEYL